MIAIEQGPAGVYEVTVQEGGSSSRHTVTVDPAYSLKLTGGLISEEELVRRSFEFLLAREPKESILSRFELNVIARYFPEYEQRIAP
jgi:hypothetical protein